MPAPQRRRVVTIVGTRPEAIKLAPVVRTLRADSDIDSRVVVTGQHRELVNALLPVFEIEPDHDLDLMRADQTPTSFASLALDRLGRVLEQEQPDFVLVQGDTTSAFVGALGASYLRIPVGHVEAGLRSFDIANPFPEELNRRLISVLSALHFAPTEVSRENLKRESIPSGSIVVTGNTVIDALLFMADRGESRARGIPGFSAEGHRTVLVTLHRRESFGPCMEGLLQCIGQLAERFSDIEVLYPVHPNPNVQRAVRSILSGRDRIHLLSPLDYPSFVAAMKRAYLILTDSGGVQEEAPSLGVPVLVLRDETERPEVVDAGAARLVGRRPEDVLRHATELLTDRDAHDRMARADNPFGDGQASRRIVNAIRRFLELETMPADQTGRRRAPALAASNGIALSRAV